jgi:hypothetical protein
VNRAHLLAMFVLSALSTWPACTRTTDLAQDNDDADAGSDARALEDGNVSGTDGSEADGSEADGSEADAAVSLCKKGVCACSDGIDNDGDQLTDGMDPECLYSLDDDESSFATGTHDATSITKGCQDCFFDGDSNFAEGCKRSAVCTRDSDRGQGCGGGNRCAPSDECKSACIPNTPNGCDCFGCCEVRGFPQLPNLAVRLEQSCAFDEKTLADPNKCRRCTLSESCRNACDECELCLGKTTLPAQCASTSVCSGGRPVCGAQLPCRDEEYCHLGCCLAPVLL